MRKRWIVNLWGITWADGATEYNGSRLPRDLTFDVNADDTREAVELAWCEAADKHGVLIDRTTSHVVSRIERRQVIRDDLE